jgi:Domain of unknown function (DUF4352)
MIRTTTRRQFLATGALPVAGLAMAQTAGVIDFGFSPAAAQEATPTPPIGSAQAPNWTFTVSQYVDPYQGELTRPKTPPENVRIVGAEIIIENGSDQPMSYTIRDIHLRSIEGVEYTAGEIAGEEPALVGQDLPDGERTRGWVWFGVPETDEIKEIRLIAPQPIFRVPVPPSGG